MLLPDFAINIFHFQISALKKEPVAPVWVWLKVVCLDIEKTGEE
jgi:hypothetical protein